MEPKVHRVDGMIQLSYALPQRVHLAQTYPLRSPNGSTIIVFGHDTGVTLLWRGGLPLKSEADAKSSEQSQTKEDTTYEPMTISSDDDEAPSGGLPPYEATAEFEEQAIEYDPSRPYEQDVQTLDLHLDTKVLHLALLHSSFQIQQSNFGPLSSLLTKNMVIALACSDRSIRVLTIPITPPSNKRKAQCGAMNTLTGDGSFGEQMVIIPSTGGHRTYPRGISMTASARSTMLEDTDLPDDQEQVWDLLIVSHSADISGLLLVHRVPLTNRDALDMDSSTLLRPWRRQHLAMPARQVSFNTSLFPARRHLQILVAETHGTVRIYDCLSKYDANQGSWLVSLNPGNEVTPTNVAQRKELLAACWVLDGKALAILLANGEWGLWDLEDSGPKTRKAIDGWQAASGVSLRDLAITGWIGKSPTAPEAKKTPNIKESNAQMAPMTPATRKTRQNKLFVGPESDLGRPSRGGISVCTTRDDFNNRKDDESMLIWHGTTIAIIPSLLTYWHTKLKGSGNLFGTWSQGYPKDLKTVHRRDELWYDVSLVPALHSTGTLKTTSQSSVIITSEHHIITICPPTVERPTPSETSGPDPRAWSNAADQALLAKGELDVDGIDIVLTEMSNRQHVNGTRSTQKHATKRAHSRVL